jgi:hypothetical protein
MSEYQCFEFVALDRPLTSKEMAELRSISTRAEITPTRFWNEYHWGDLRADPAKLLARYFDAHLYFTNWGTHRFMLRLPAASVNERTLRPYFVGTAVTLVRRGRHILLDLISDSNEPEDESYEGGQLAALAPLRSQLVEGDLSAAYLAWLLAVQSEEVDDAAIEPPVPGGLSTPSAPLSALGEFLRIDPDLLKAAAEESRANVLDVTALRRWLKGLPTTDKDRWLLRACRHPNNLVGPDIMAAYRRSRGLSSDGHRRTVAQIRERATELRQAREQEEARRAARARARAEVERQTRLDKLARQGEKPWALLDKLVDHKEYDEAVRLTVDLRALASRSRRASQFESRLDELRKRHPRRRGYLDAIKRELGR